MKRRNFFSSVISGGLLTGWARTATATMPAASQDDVDAALVPAPLGALVLFDGKSLSGWVYAKTGEPAGWLLSNGAMEVKGGSIHTREKFGDIQLHVEFWLPYMPEAKGQGRANSGVYLQGLYEVQILDSYGLQSKNNDCGAIYGVAPPLKNVCKKPERWQSYDIAFRTPRFDGGQLKESARVTVFHNGVLIHNNQEVPVATRASMQRDPTQPGPILLQDHRNPVRFRNIWIIPG